MKLKPLFRNLSRDGLNSIVIIISLALGMACFNLIILFITREMKADDFQKDNDRIYALQCDDPWVPGGKMYFCKYGSAEYMKKNFARVKDFCRISNSGSQKIEANNHSYYDKPTIIRTSPNFFSFFSYRLLSGSPETVLESNNNIVISEELAKKYFGTTDVNGKVITIVNTGKAEHLTISGVFEKPVESTQITFDMIQPIGEEDSRCYVMLSKNSDSRELENLFKEKKDVIPVIYDGTPGPYYLKSLKDTYFDTLRGRSFEVNRDKNDLWISLVIGILIISIAVFNYLGILTNKFLRRIKEYYIRRVNGGSKAGFVFNFMVENTTVVMLSFFIACLLMIIMLPFFNELTRSSITEGYILRADSLKLLFAVPLFILANTFIYTLYLVFSNVSLKNILTTNNNFRVKSIYIPWFNIFQLGGSIALIICSVIIIRQMIYISNKPIGLNKDVIEVKLPGNFADKSVVFREELMKNSCIDNVSVVGASPVLEHYLLLLHYNSGGVDKQYSPAGFSGDQNYLRVLGIDLQEGSDFSETLSSNKNKCLINQSFASLFKGRDLIGHSVPGMEEMIIIGVVKDFNYSGLKQHVGPAFISFSEKGNHLLVKPENNQEKKALIAVSETWNKLIPGYPVNTETVGERFEWFHRENKKFISLIGACAIISLFLSMMGLFAVVYQKTRSRTKEIGIRKINGAGISNIMVLINRDFIKWVIIAFIISAPVSWYAMRSWLANYAYKVNISWLIYLTGGIIVLLVTLITVSLESIRAATLNPADTLRYE
ncbi:MAG TPA: ABC transporter permease [Bacteroidales bacterium]|nr:ABC transporter permease [Bacteroidales bacterium]